MISRATSENRGDEIGLVGHAGHADDGHGEGNGHAQQHQQQHRGKTDERFNHVRLGEGPA
jgi:hypothetical protein